MFGILNRVYKLNFIFIKLNSSILKIVLSSRFIPIILSLAIVCWVLNTKQPMVGSNGNFGMDFTLEKKIGLSWTFMQNPTDFYNKSYLMINGFGINVPGAMVNSGR